MSQTSPSVLVIRLDGVGDALALAPLLAALNERAIPADLVLTQSNLDAFAPAAARDRWAAPFALRDTSYANRAVLAEFAAVLRARSYTHALVATEDPAGYRLALASGAPVRIGFANGWGKPFKSLWVRPRLTQVLYRSARLDPRSPHECEVLFGLGAMLLGAGAEPTRDLARLRPLVLASEPAPDGRIGFQVTDKWERLGIAFDRVVACVNALAPKGVRAFGSAHELPYVSRFEQATGISVEIFNDVPAWKTAIAASRVLVAPDGGAIHVAGTIGTPVAAVFAPQRGFALQSARWAPWAAPYRIVEARGDWAPAAIAAVNALADSRHADTA